MDVVRLPKRRLTAGVISSWPLSRPPPARKSADDDHPWSKSASTNVGDTFIRSAVILALLPALQIEAVLSGSGGTRSFVACRKHHVDERFAAPATLSSEHTSESRID